LRAILLFNKGCNSPRLALPSLSSPSPLNLLSPFLLSLSLPRFPLPPLFRSSPSLSSLTRFPLSSLSSPLRRVLSVLSLTPLRSLSLVSPSVFSISSPLAHLPPAPGLSLPPSSLFTLSLFLPFPLPPSLPRPRLLPSHSWPAAGTPFTQPAGVSHSSAFATLERKEDVDHRRRAMTFLFDPSTW